jgi:RNA polymerase sigma-70 factor (ECF subfamily)
LTRYVLRISSFSDEDIEDILQEVFIKVYQNLNDFDLSLKFNSWIYRITHNQVISAHRKDKARPQGNALDLDEAGWNRIASDLDIERDADQAILKSSINKVLLTMDDKYKEVLILKYLEEKDYKEISDILKKPMGTVASLINRAKQNFLKEIKKQDIKI